MKNNKKLNTYKKPKLRVHGDVAKITKGIPGGFEPDDSFSVVSGT